MNARSAALTDFVLWMVGNQAGKGYISAEAEQLLVFADFLLLLQLIENYQIKQFNVTDEFRSRINGLIIEALSSRYLNEDAVFDTADNIADVTNAFYFIIVTEHYNSFAFLVASDGIEEIFTENDRVDLLGFPCKRLLDAYDDVKITFFKCSLHCSKTVTFSFIMQYYTILLKHIYFYLRVA